MADFFSPIPDDFLNIGTAGFLSQHFTILTFEGWLIMTYTVIAWSLIVLGVWIYPRNSHDLFSSILKTTKTKLKELISNPIYLILGIAVLIISIKIYKTYFLKTP